MSKSTTYLASKPRYEILDGLRGVAALLVVAYHLLEIHYHGGPEQPINHGYLAVDFFFVLSGFVIGYAYDDRWSPNPSREGSGVNGFTLWTFFKRRLIRLHPMVIFGTLFGTEGESRWTNGLYEAFCILICFPLIVAIGAGSSVMGGKSEAINRFLGDISYPLYITHFPLIYMLMSWTDSHKDAPIGTHIFVSVCVFILAILIAYGAYRLYDLPVREWL